jgi:cyclophilin family peptidyl-prolyl cis-trans isomerase
MKVAVRVVAVLVAVVLAAGQAIGEQTTSSSPRGRGASQPAGGRATTAAKPSAGAGPVVVMETVKGAIEFETYPNEAPKSVAHILALVKRNFYNGLRVHRVEPGFVVQFGDPQTRDMSKRALWGRQGSGRPIGAAEMNPKRTHRLGAVALAHAGDPRLADSQLYITMAATPRLDGDYTVIGQVISGMDVVSKLQVTDIIRRLTVKQPAPAAAK